MTGVQIVAKEREKRLMLIASRENQGSVVTYIYLFIVGYI